MIALTNLTFKNPECAYLRLESVKYDKRIFFSVHFSLTKIELTPCLFFPYFGSHGQAFFPRFLKSPITIALVSLDIREIFSACANFWSHWSSACARANCADFFPGVKKSGAVGSSHEKIRLF